MKNIIKRALAALLVLSMLAVCFVGCRDDGTIDPAQAIKDAENILASKEYRDTYKTYFSTSYSSLNYFSTSYATVREIVSNCIDGLVEPDIYGNYVGSMAESWEHNDDYTVWTFKIRQGLKWIDYTGAETEYAVTAQDFVDGIKYIGDPLNGAYSLRVVRNLISGLYDYYWGLDDIDCEIDTTTKREDLVAKFDEIVGVKALDEYTVQYTLDSGAPYFLSLIESSMLLLPIEYDYAMALGEDFGVDNTKMLYCGAYYVYVKFATVKGLSKNAVLKKHVFRNAIIPLSAYLPADLLNIISGSLVIETLYAIPGTGGLLTTAIKQQDNNLVQILVLMYAVMSILGVFLGDILLTFVDPRIKLAD